MHIRVILISLLMWASAVCIFGADDNRPVVDDSKFGKDKAASNALPTLFFVGDSTMNSNSPMRGWASEAAAFFDLTKINVVNRAIGGRSSRTYQAEGKWDKVLGEMKAGDFVVVQFGHNDAGKYDDPAAKNRPSLKGEGDDTAEVIKDAGAKEIVHTFGWYMRKFGNDARAKGVHAIFCSMIPHKNWKDAKIVRGERFTFVTWTANAAAATGAGFVDMNEIIAEGYEKLGSEKVESFFADARTHTSPIGAKYNAAAFVAGLRAQGVGELNSYFNDSGKAVEPTTAQVMPLPTTQPAQSK